MVTRIRGFRGKTRSKLSKSYKEKGKISLSQYFMSYDSGETVTLKCNPAVQGGLYHPKYHGKVGTIGKKIGNCYQVKILDSNKAKTLIVHPVHVKKCQDQKL